VRRVTAGRVPAYLKVFLLLILFFSASTLQAASIADSTKEYTLRNGLKVLVVEDHKSPLVTFEIWYKIGSSHESIGKTGLSHFLEHMMFKGTQKYGSKTLSHIIQRNGGANNAFTTKEYTVYFESLSSDRVTIPIELESDRMTNLVLDPKEVESERSVVMEERRMRYDDNPQNLLNEEVMALAFSAHPYRWPVIGWMSDIAGLGRSDVYMHYRQNYSPDNAFIVIAGDVNTDTLLPELEKDFGGIAPAAKRPLMTTTKEPQQQGEKRVYIKKEAVQLPYILIAYHTPSFPGEDSFALEVLSNILAEGKSSRLYRNLVYEKRIAINAFADYSGLNRDPFLFTLGATAAAGKDISEVEKLLYDEIDRIKKDPPSEREVQKAKNQIEASFVFAQDSNYSKAHYTGLFEVMGGWKLMDTYINGIRNVKSSDVQAVAKKYFNVNDKTVGILLPEKGSGQ
jgi:zinc protease